MLLNIQNNIKTNIVNEVENATQLKFKIIDHNIP